MGVYTPWEDMKRCVLNADGTVNYYLDAADSTQKAAGGAATLTGADGNVMVEIPAFYFKSNRIGETNFWRVRTTPATGYTIHPAFVKDGVQVANRYISAYDACLKFSRSITAVADAGGGDITVTTSVQHPLYAGDSVTISGTTDYNGTYTVVSRASTTTFTVTAAFVSTQTGTAAGYVSGKNLDNVSAIIQTGTDTLASVSGQYPLVGVTRNECRLMAANNGTGWRQLDFWLVQAIQMLFLVEYGTFRSQATLGAGNTNGSYLINSDSQNDSPHTIAGASNSLGNASTNTTTGAGVDAKPGTSFMSYRGIENFYGNAWNWVDGMNVNIGTAGTVYVSNTRADFADNTATNHTLLTSSLPTALGFVRNLLDIQGAFLASSVTGGSSTTFITDQLFATTATNRVAFFGGAALTGALAGAFCWLLTIDSSFRRRDFSARLAF